MRSRNVFFPQMSQIFRRRFLQILSARSVVVFHPCTFAGNVFGPWHKRKASTSWRMPSFKSRSFTVIKLLAISYYLLPLLTSCQSDKPLPKPQTQVSGIRANVLVTNEGTFQFNNASLTFLNGFSGELTNNLWRDDKWDVIQSATLHNGRLYVVVNNSGKIEILHPQSFQRLGTITGLRSPRYFLPISSTKAYVTDLNADAISVLDLTSNTVAKQISCPGWTEKLVYHLGKVYVTNYWKPYLYQIDPLTDLKTDSILIGMGAQSIVVDKYDRLVISCGGYNIKQTENQIAYVNARTKSVEKRIPFAKNYPSGLTINATKDTLYYLNTNLYQLSVEENAEPRNFFISGAGKNFYGLDVDPGTNLLFVADAVDYVQNGKAYVYNAAGLELTSFEVGIAPNGFCFY